MSLFIRFLRNIQKELPVAHPVFEFRTCTDPDQPLHIDLVLATAKTNYGLFVNILTWILAHPKLAHSRIVFANPQFAIREHRAPPM